MPFSLSVSGNKAQVVGELIRVYNEATETKIPGTTEFVAIAEMTLRKFSEVSQDEGRYSVVVSGHVKQQPDERDYLVISIAAAD